MPIALRKIRIIQRSHIEVIILFVIISVLSFEKLAFYVRFDFNLILLLLVLPFVIIKKENRPSYRYAWIAIVLFTAYFFLKLSTIFFFGVVCSLFFLYESNYGKLSGIPLLLVVIVSPIAIYFAELAGFEIRLWLTSVSAKLLSFIHPLYASRGNIILYGEREYRVDPECMGLNMLILSFFITLVIIVYQQKQKKISINFFTIFLLMVLTFLLVIVSNIFRIITITLFNAPPESFSHEIIGIICFAGYVFVPVWLIARLIKGNEKVIKTSQSINNNGTWLKRILSIVILLQLMLFNFFNEKPGKKIIIEKPEINITGENLKVFQADHGVIKLVNNEMLLYVKPSVNFYTSEHTPLICWKGSGYKIQNEQKMRIDDYQVYFGELHKGEDILYTTWWYDCGINKTMSQFIWRSRQMIYNEKYRLINVVCNNSDKLKEKTKKIINQNIFKKQ